jgi:ABC-type multidrug transport system ATPase subunit
MSEPILKALMQLFALISDVHDSAGISSKGKDIVRLFLARHLNNELVTRYMEMFEEYLIIYHSESIAKGSMKHRKHTSLVAMRILAICEKINEELHQKQKLYVIVQLMDFLSFSAEITEVEMDFLETVATSFNLPPEEYQNIKNFILNPVTDIPERNMVMIIDNLKECEQERFKHLFRENLRGNIYILYIASSNSYFLRYSGKDDLFLNGQNVFPGQTYSFEYGSGIRSKGIETIYYSDINSVFTDEAFKVKISMNATDVCFRFKNSENGIHKLNFHEESGKLVGIMGGSGVGKSTLLNVLSGITRPQSGEVLINGYNLYTENGKDQLKGVIGFIPQDDLLIEELTVYQNLYYNARMCLDNLSEPVLKEAVNKTLTDLDLFEISDLKVGNPLNKIISGGQRKRLNIALELIREPTILFVDEPTSGLSSVDSEIVMNLLKEQTYRGKLVIINIHQPGSDIYKMFDRILIIDKGGYQIFYGNPTEAIVYFKRKASLANADEDQCITCGNINADQLLQIIEAKVVNEHGKPTPIRKITPLEWSEKFQENTENVKKKVYVGDGILPENYYSIPNILKQSKIFFIRDILSKSADKQYVLISLFGAPILAFLLAYFTKYTVNGDYIFSKNENLPPYLFMCVITSLFLGLIISAEEIVKDRKILKRESFLNLSWLSYLNSKIMIMFLISAIQTLSFILIGNSILEIKGMTISYWIILFTTSCLANMMGLNISSAFNSVITIYILIPFILIPQLLFSGVLVKFDKLHKSNLSSYEYVPVIGDMMPARWSFEALAVRQFKDNNFEKHFFGSHMKESQNAYSAMLIDKLNDNLWRCRIFRDSAEHKDIVNESFGRLNYHIDELAVQAGMVPGKWKSDLNINSFNQGVYQETKKFLDSLKRHFNFLLKEALNSENAVNSSLEKALGREGRINLQNNYENKRLNFFILDLDNQYKTYETPEKIIQKLNPGYMQPASKYGRAQFYAPYKLIGNNKIDTYWFNVFVLWIVTLVLYITLYYNILQKIIGYFENLRFTKADN